MRAYSKRTIDPWGKRHPKWRKLKVLQAKVNQKCFSMREKLKVTNPEIPIKHDYTKWRQACRQNNPTHANFQ